MSILLALCSALVYGTSDYCGGRAARRAPVIVVTLVGQFVSGMLTVVVVAALGDPLPAGSDVAWSAAAGTMSTIGIAAFYYALANGAMTVVAPITAVVSAVVPVAVGFAIGERPSAWALVGVALALAAVALVSGLLGVADRPTAKVIALLAVVAGLGFGLLFVFLDRTSDDSGLWPLLVGQVVSIVLMAGAMLASRERVTTVRPVIGLTVLAGTGSVFANVCYLLATRRGLLSLVAVITSLYPATTVGLATILDGERLSRSQVMGMGLALVAVGLVSAGS
jgi:drug/metabolite transporter (DMT)-like permease